MWFYHEIIWSENYECRFQINISYWEQRFLYASVYIYMFR